MKMQWPSRIQSARNASNVLPRAAETYGKCSFSYYTYTILCAFSICQCKCMLRVNTWKQIHLGQPKVTCNFISSRNIHDLILCMQQHCTYIIGTIILEIVFVSVSWKGGICKSLTIQNSARPCFRWECFKSDKYIFPLQTL